MALAKVGRKIKRTGKSAVQFKFTATFEYIDVECTGAWRPEEVKVIWQRAHRKIESNGVQWQAVADRGPEGATGRALFNPPISVALIITLYRGAKSTEFEEKEYKFYIANEGKSGKKILASFHCNVANYAGIPNTKSALELDCKAVSKKIRQAHLGLTMESEYIKEGSANDDDMQSTYSHVPDYNDDPVMEQDSDEEEPADNQDVKATGNGQVHDPGNTGQSTHGTGSEADQRKPLSLEKGVVSGKESGVDCTEGVHEHTTEPIPKSVVGDGERAVNETKEHIKDDPVGEFRQNGSHAAETKEKQGESIVETKDSSSPPDNSEEQGPDTKKVAQGNEQKVDSNQPQATPNKPRLDAVEPSIHDEGTTKEKHDVAEGWRSDEKSSETHEQPKTDEGKLSVSKTVVLSKSEEEPQSNGSKMESPKVDLTPQLSPVNYQLETVKDVEDDKPPSSVDDQSHLAPSRVDEKLPPSLDHQPDVELSRMDEKQPLSLDHQPDVELSRVDEKQPPSLDHQPDVELSRVEQPPSLDHQPDVDLSRVDEKQPPSLDHQPNGELSRVEQPPSLDHQVDDVQSSPPDPQSGLTPSGIKEELSSSLDHQMDPLVKSDPMKETTNKEHDCTSSNRGEASKEHHPLEVDQRNLREDSRLQSKTGSSEEESASNIPPTAISSNNEEKRIDCPEKVATGAQVERLEDHTEHGSGVGPVVPIVASNKEILPDVTATGPLIITGEKVDEHNDKLSIENKTEDDTPILTHLQPDCVNASSGGNKAVDSPLKEDSQFAQRQNSEAPPKKPPRTPKAVKKDKYLTAALVDKVTSPKSMPESLAMVESINVEDLSKWLPPTTQLVNAINEPVAMDTLYHSKVFGLYFTAMWCPPCRKFIPKLVKFYEILKDNNARFSIVYVSSDHTEEDMLEHLSTNGVTFPAIKFSDPNSDKLREKFGIRQVPHLVIVDSTGKVIDDRARKVVEVSQTGSSAMHCYGKWLEGEPAPREKKGVLVSLFSRGGSKKEELIDEGRKSPEVKVTSASSLNVSQTTSQSSLNDEKGTQMKRIRVESHMKSSLSSVSRENNLLAELEEKSSIIRDLEVKNEALEQRISDLTEENQTLKGTIEEQKKRLKEIETAQSTLLEEKQSIVAKANMKGFLLKRGVRGPTGRKWRRRFFRTDGAGRLCYYKIAEDTTPLGFIELQNVIAVKVAPDSVQDKNHCTFVVVVEGRTFEFLAMNQDEMAMWIDAIKYLSDWHKKNVGKPGGAQLS